MIIPCIDLMDGKVVQLVQGREKVLERSTDEMLEQFQGFDQIQVIDLDAALGRGSNQALVAQLAATAAIRAGGGVRTVERARELMAQGAYRIIVGSAAFHEEGPNLEFLSELSAAVTPASVTIALDTRQGRIVVDGWRSSTGFSASEVVSELEPYCSGFLCTYVDKEGLMQGTDLEWFESLRKTTDHELIAAGGISTLDDVKALTSMDIHAAIGMSIYTGKLRLEDLREFNALALRS